MQAKLQDVVHTVLIVWMMEMDTTTITKLALWFQQWCHLNTDVFKVSIENRYYFATDYFDE